jgi:uncharacterized membrane protein HdeD (DUF308 family)
MKTIRYLAAGLLLLTGVLHILPIFKTPSDPNSVPMLVFGIFYFAIGVLLIMKIRFDSLLGIVFPLIGLATGFFVVGIKNWDNMLIFLFAIDVLVVILCLVLFLKGNKG